MARHNGPRAGTDYCKTEACPPLDRCEPREMPDTRRLVIANRRPPLPNHKRIRLDAGDYGRPGAICSVTVAVRAREPIFTNPDIASAAVDVLRLHSRRKAIKVYGYCVMPDHVHMIIEPAGTCDIVTFVGQIKSFTLRRAWAHGVRGSFWQTSFWDHFLREEEALEDAVTYVLNNLVRAGLVEKRGEYPYSGSLVLEL